MNQGVDMYKEKARKKHELIMEARKILLLATGKNKSSAINAALNEPIGPNCPASFLRQHPDCTFLVDEAAAKLCKSDFS